MKHELQKALANAIRLNGSQEFNEMVNKATEKYHEDPVIQNAVACTHTNDDELSGTSISVAGEFVASVRENHKSKKETETKPETFSENTIKTSKLPNSIKDMFRNRTRLGTTEGKDGELLFTHNGLYWRYRTYTHDDVAKQLTMQLGPEVKLIEDWEPIIRLFNAGFSIVPSFYGNKNCLCVSTSWFNFTGVQYNAEELPEKTISITICYSKGKDGVDNFTTYSNSKGYSRKVGVFNELDDIIEIFALNTYVPSIATYDGTNCDSSLKVQDCNLKYCPDYSKLESLDRMAEIKATDKSKYIIERLEYSDKYYNDKVAGKTTLK